MKLRPHVLRALVRKDVARLLRNGPALMMLGLLVIVAFVTASSGLVEEAHAAPAAAEREPIPWIVYWDDNDWIRTLKRRARGRIELRFVDATELGSDPYPPDALVIEVRQPVLDRRNGVGRGVTRQHIRYRYPGSDPNALWPVTRWFLSASTAYFGEIPQFLETIEPITPPTRAQRTQAALESVSIADVLSLPLIATALLTMIQFFGACGLLVSLTAQERERGTLRALLLTPASFFEFMFSKALVHGGLAIGTSALAISALQPAALSSPLFWTTMVVMTCGYLAVGTLITSFAKNQAAPNLLSFAYLLVVGAMNLLAHRFEAFQFLSSLSFERYGLLFTIASLEQATSETASTASLLGSRQFFMFALIAIGLLLIATFVGQRRMRAD